MELGKWCFLKLVEWAMIEGMPVFANTSVSYEEIKSFLIF